MADNQTQTDDLSLKQLEELAEGVTQPEEPLTPDAPTPAESLTPGAPTPPEPVKSDPSVTPLEVARAELMGAERALGAAEAKVKEALAERNKCGKHFGKLRETGKLSLHELNQQQRKITRVENSRRFRAQDAMKQLVGHYRAGKRESYPLSDAARAAVGEVEE